MTYRVKQGDTLDADRGRVLRRSRADAVFIIAENKMLQGARKLDPASGCTIPVTREIATAKGDTFESLAGQYLGDAKRATFLAEVNDMRRPMHCRRAPMLVVPFAVAHVAQRAESLAAVATTFYGDRNRPTRCARTTGSTRRRSRRARRSSCRRCTCARGPSTRRRSTPTRRSATSSEARAPPMPRPRCRSRAAAWREGDFAQVRDHARADREAARLPRHADGGRGRHVARQGARRVRGQGRGGRGCSSRCTRARPTTRCRRTPSRRRCSTRGAPPAARFDEARGDHRARRTRAAARSHRRPPAHRARARGRVAAADRGARRGGARRPTCPRRTCRRFRGWQADGRAIARRQRRARHRRRRGCGGAAPKTLAALGRLRAKLTAAHADASSRSAGWAHGEPSSRRRSACSPRRRRASRQCR